MSSVFITLSKILGLYTQINKLDDEIYYDKVDSSIFLVKNFNYKSESIINDINDEYLSVHKNIDTYFYKELEESKNLLIKIKDSIKAVRTGLSLYNKNTLFQRSIECLDLNINFLNEVLQIFLISKLFSNSQNNRENFYKKLSNRNGSNEKLWNFIFIVQKFHLIKIYFYTIINFHNLRHKYGEFYYINIDEENRFIEALRKFYLLNEVIEKSSKMGILFLRTLKFYLWKVLKSLNVKFTCLMSVVKLGFYVTKINFLCYVSANFLIYKENNLFEKPITHRRWKDIYSNTKIEVNKKKFYNNFI